MLEKFPRSALWSDERGRPYIDQLGRDLELLKSKLGHDGSIVSELGGKRIRITRKSAGIYTAIAASSDADRINSKKIMGAEVNAILSAAPAIEASVTTAEQRTRRLIHNLKSLTAKTNQEIFNLVQQNAMMASPREMVAYVSGEIARAPDETAKALIEILKHQAAQKAEYSSFEKLSGRVSSIRHEQHEIHRVIMNVLYLFYSEFVDKKVRFVVDSTNLKALFDYESIHVCIYYLIENAAKYTMRNSVLNITFAEDGRGMVDIRFAMESLAVDPDEEDSVFNEGVSGRRAESNKLSGSGLGLYLAREMAALNRGSLFLHAGKAINGSTYARNTFVLSLKAI
ncbi:hypothetical protein MX652_08600 [Thauera aromatica]|nr:ATP-binding protein [Thauera aromatica]MCK2126746.1 hypothetical protein [Thauera aromatica]